MFPTKAIFPYLILAGTAFAQTPTPPPTSESPALTNRLYARDTATYDPAWALGRFGIFDRANNVIIEFIEKPRMACDPATVLGSVTVKQMPPTQSYYFVADKNYKGSLSFFTASGSLSDTERQEVSLTDVATVDIGARCELSNAKIFEIAKTLAGAAGKSVFWVSGTTMSNLTKEVFSETSGDGGLSAGSWLSIGGSYYKGSQKIDAVPVTSLRGIAVDVPSSPTSARPAVKPFSTLQDLGLSPNNLKFQTK